MKSSREIVYSFLHETRTLPQRVTCRPNICVREAAAYLQAFALAAAKVAFNLFPFLNRNGVDKSVPGKPSGDGATVSEEVSLSWPCGSTRYDVCVTLDIPAQAMNTGRGCRRSGKQRRNK